MGTHFHPLAAVRPGSMLSDDEVRRRFHVLYGDGDEAELPEGRVSDYRAGFSGLSAYVKDIKQIFSRF